MNRFSGVFKLDAQLERGITSQRGQAVTGLEMEDSLSFALESFNVEL